MAGEMAGQVPEAHRLGRGQHRGDAELLPTALAHHKYMKSTNMLKRLNEEIKRPSHVIRSDPDLSQRRELSAARPRRPDRSRATTIFQNSTHTTSFHAANSDGLI
jgi:hypothetical protein